MSAPCHESSDASCTMGCYCADDDNCKDCDLCVDEVRTSYDPTKPENMVRIITRISQALEKAQGNIHDRNVKDTIIMESDFMYSEITGKIVDCAITSGRIQVARAILEAVCCEYDELEKLVGTAKKYGDYELSEYIDNLRIVKLACFIDHANKFPELDD